MRPRRVPGTVLALLAVSACLTACTSSSGDGAPSTRPDTIPSSRAKVTSSPPLTPTSISPGASTSASATPARVTYHSGLAVPDRVVTPGSALAGVSSTQVCTRGWNMEHNKIGYGVRNEVSSRYGLVAGPGTTLHLDQLIPASLGGDVTTRNVWPQPEAQLRTKNDLEAHLHQLVCSGQLSLTTAQQAIAGDWTAALRQYPPA